MRREVMLVYSALEVSLHWTSLEMLIGRALVNGSGRKWGRMRRKTLE